MKKAYETPTVEKISFRYRDQVVAASGGGQLTGGNENIFESSEFGGCYDIGDVGELLLNGVFGDCSWINQA